MQTKMPSEKWRFYFRPLCVKLTWHKSLMQTSASWKGLSGELANMPRCFYIIYTEYIQQQRVVAIQDICPKCILNSNLAKFRFLITQGSTLTVVRLGIPSSLCCRTTWTYVYGCPLVKSRKLIKWIILGLPFISDWINLTCSTLILAISICLH